ncbi:hypothetical protein [Streptomyces sp. NPDC001889]
MRPRLVLVHGIGPPRDPARERAEWTAALATGMRAAGHSRLAAELTGGRGIDTVFAHYGDLFRRDQAQGQGGGHLPAGPGAALLAELLIAWVDALAEATDDPRERALLDHARAQAQPRAQSQGGPALVRRALNVATTVLSLRPWGPAARWITPRLMVHHLAQVARYLARGEEDATGRALHRRARARVAEALGEGPALVVSHSLGTVVALETLHEHPAPVPLFVTLGSPIAMRTVVWPRLLPQPPSVPDSVHRWLNFWDRDDLIAVRPRLERELRPGPTGVLPVSTRTDADGLWVHSATTYLARPDVAGPVAEALTDSATGPG